eukprot:TRINITY_DN74008_c0_g1_i1.p1 TRINITY_DN74008_c0_g1~~TRINITY_DN74008_c0_g1_i1.p1  ORF type:complete len:402 (-),score=66.41 TRINITY_DN74008_c0_g1_i1:174-1379(-)
MWRHLEGVLLFFFVQMQLAHAKECYARASIQDGSWRVGLSGQHNATGIFGSKLYALGSDGGLLPKEQATALVPPDGLQSGDDFGGVIATAGQWLVLGAKYRHPESNRSTNGAFYVYMLHDSIPRGAVLVGSVHGQWTPGVYGTELGQSLSMTPEGRLVAGTVLDMACVYSIHAEHGLNLLTELRPFGNTTKQVGSMAFGFSVAASSELVAVGAKWDSEHGQQAGAVYFYRVTGDGRSVPIEKLVYGGVQAQFGWSVALDYDQSMLVASSVSYYGAVLAYKLAASAMSKPVLVAEIKGSLYPDFGYSVAVSNSHIVVGAPATAGVSDAVPTVHLLEANASSVHEVARINASTASLANSSFFGFSVAIHNNLIVAAAPKNATPSVLIFECLDRYLIARMDVFV